MAKTTYATTTTTAKTIDALCKQIETHAAKVLPSEALARSDENTWRLLRRCATDIADDMNCAARCPHRQCREAGACRKPLMGGADGSVDATSCLAANGREMARARGRMFNQVFFAQFAALDHTRDDA